MNASTPSTPSSTPRRVPDGVLEAAAVATEDDYAIGCECANPALQIESWAGEPVAQPLQRLF
jgi:hypothetical protein